MIPGISVFLSNRLCQDQLEIFPNVTEFLKNTQALRVINNTANVRGNRRGSMSIMCKNEPYMVENATLRKRNERTELYKYLINMTTQNNNMNSILQQLGMFVD